MKKIFLLFFLTYSLFSHAQLGLDYGSSIFPEVINRPQQDIDFIRDRYPFFILQYLDTVANNYSNGYKYLSEKNQKGDFTRLVRYNWSGIDWRTFLDHKSTFTYNSTDKLTEKIEITSSQTVPGGSKVRSRMDYDNQNRPTAYFVETAPNVSSNSYTIFGKTIMGYDQNGKRIVDTTLQVPDGEQSLNYYSKQEYSYTANTITSVVKFWNKTTQSFETSSKTEAEYTSSDKLISYNRFRYESATQTYTPTGRFLYAYDNQNRISSITDYRADSVIGVTPFFKSIYTYRSDNQLDSLYEYEASGNGNWKLSWVMKVEYNNSGKAQIGLYYNVKNGVLDNKAVSRFIFDEAVTLATSEQLAASDIVNVYPNPVYTGEVKIQVPGGCEVEVYDLTGKYISVELKTCEGGYYLNCDNLNPGIYQLKISSGTEIYFKKLMIQ